MNGARRTLATAATVVGVVAAVTLLVLWLRATAPVADTSALAVPEAAVDTSQRATCETVGAEVGEAPDSVVRRTTSADVLECPGAFDGRRVSYLGEVVGDVLDRDEGVWLLVNDDDYALVSGPLGASGEASGTNSGIAVWVPSPLDEAIETPGRADVRSP